MDKQHDINGETIVTKRYDDGGQRVTSCCGCYSTYMDAGDGSEVLCCKACYNEVDFGEGDGSEFRAGVDPDLYYKNLFAAEEVEAERRAFQASS